jgi:hypothetical protein
MNAGASLSRLLEALHLDPPVYAWLGECHRVVPRPGEEEGAFERALAQRLYADWYTAGAVAPSTVAGEDVEAARPYRPDDLSAANCGSGSRQRGWRATVRRNGRVLVERDGLRLWADEEHVLGAGGEPDLLEIVVPKESFGPPAGFYTAFGDAGIGGAAHEPVDRFYWNIRGEGRTALLVAVTRTLNDGRLPFRFKVVNEAAARCDAGVLYTPTSMRVRMSEPLGTILAAVSDELRPSVPCLAKRLAPGLGFAESPPGDESFGTHRCAILAKSLIAADAAGAVTTRDRLAFVEERLAQGGISLDAPYLNPGSDPAADPARVAA